LTNLDTKVSDFSSFELTFRRIDGEVVVLEDGENLGRVTPEFFKGVRSDKYVIDIDEDMSCGDKDPEDGIHERLENGWGVGNSEGHYLAKKMTVFANEGQQLFGGPGGLDIVEAPSDIQLREVPESFEPVEDFPDKGERIGFLLRNLIKLLIVNNRTEFVIFLLEEEWRSPGGMSTVDVSSCQVFIDPFPKFCMVGFRHWVELGTIRPSSFLKLDVEVHTGSVWRENVEVLLSEDLQKSDCPVGGSRGDMCDSVDHRARFLCTLSEFYFSGNPINQRIVFPKPIIPKHEFVALILPKETGNSFLMPKSEIDNDLCHVGDEPISIQSSIYVVGDHRGMEPSGWKIVVSGKICIHD